MIVSLKDFKDNFMDVCFFKEIKEISKCHVGLIT